MSKKILVIGDACTDVFNYCRCTRLCPEAPVPVLDLDHQTSNKGMAGNVARNIEDLGGNVVLLCNKNSDKVTKTRYVDVKTNHMFCRIDSHDKIRHAEHLGRVLWTNYAAIVISDYDKGFLTEKDIQFVSGQHPLTFLDTKKSLGRWAEDIAFIKINRKEYTASSPFLTDTLQSKIIQTLGEEGCVYHDKKYPVSKVEIKNLSGAGDSFLAALVVNYLQTNSIEKALVFANEIATIVVQKMGVSTIKS